MKKFILIAVVLCVSSLLVDAQPLWVSGSDQHDLRGTYNNSLGKLNEIGSRAQAACWGGDSRHAHVAWIFGGMGIGNGTATIEVELEAGPLNDLWTFNTASEVWTYESGSPIPLDPGQYPPTPPTPPTPGAALHPGSRKGAAHWQGDGLLWVFGGFGAVPGEIVPPEPEPLEGTLNDIWAYNATSKTWQFRGGTQQVDLPPQYTTDPLTLAPPNPGSRECSSTWVVRNETSGEDTLWLFGGMGGEEVYQSDVWSYHLATNVWTYHNITNVTGVPSARSCGASWVGPDGNLYLFGGQEIDPMFETITLLNDIWELNTTSLQWRNILLPSLTGVYDNTTNARPSPRFGAGFTSDSLGNFWLFGGHTPLIEEAADTMNDLWTYNTTGRYWTWILGSSLPNQRGVYNATTRLGTPSSRGYACLWIDEADRLWMFGGANSTEEEFGHSNDLWKLYDIVIPKPPTTTTTGGHNDTTSGHSLTTGAVSITTGAHNETITTGPLVSTTGASLTTGAHNTTFSLTTGPVNTSTIGGLTTGGQVSITTGSHNTTGGLTTGPSPATITTASVTSGNSTTHHPVSPAVISGTIMGGSVAVGLGIAGVFLYRRRQRQRDSDGDAELLPLNRKKAVN